MIFYVIVHICVYLTLYILFMLHKSSLIISVRVVVCLMLLQYVQQYTVKPVLRGHLWDKEKVAL